MRIEAYHAFLIVYHAMSEKKLIYAELYQPVLARCNFLMDMR